MFLRPNNWIARSLGKSMLKSLHFKNFKSWADARVDCAPITGFFGTNSSGKTSIIQFLLMLKQTKDGTDRAISLDLNGDLVSLGTITDVIHKHDVDLPLQWDVKFELENELSITDASKQTPTLIAKSKKLGINASNVIQNGAPRANRLSYRLGIVEFALVPKAEQAAQFDLRCVMSESDNIGFQFVRTQGRAWRLPGPIKSYAFPDQARTYFQNAAFLADLEASYEAQLDRVYYLGPLRQYPQRDYLWTRSRPTDVGKQGEKAIDAILAATESGETRNLKHKGKHKSFQEMVAYWLKEMGLIEDFKVEEIGSNSNRWQARVRTKKQASEVLLTDVGFGISQVLPVVTLLQYVPEGSTVVLEQPEIHLHPLAQAALADVIIQAATHRNVQVILESHSEHLLLRLQRRIAEETISNEDVRLYFCDTPKGESTLTRLEVDLFGNIKNWPDKFMGDAFEETARAELARLERMQDQKPE
jgi:predicted ATPase